MARTKQTEGIPTTVEIYKLDLVKMKCIASNESMKDYINRLIRDDFMTSNEYWSNLYFKDIE